MEVAAETALQTMVEAVVEMAVQAVLEDNYPKPFVALNKAEVSMLVLTMEVVGVKAVMQSSWELKW
jgi:hypothetical protein